MRFSSVELRTRHCYAALAAFAIILIAAFVLLDHFAPAGRRVAKIGGIDPAGYFGVSHSLLFHHDFDLNDEFQRVKPDDNPWTGARKETGHRGSVWGIGYSLLAVPFLAAGTAVDALVGNPADGYSRFAMLGYCLANVALTGLGLIALFAFLHRTARLWAVPESLAAACALSIVVAVFFGTTAGYYAFSQMAHASTFFGASLFLAWWWKIRERADIRSWMLLGFIGGVLSICRWQDVIYLGGPLLFDLMGGLCGIKTRLKSRIVYAAVAACCWIPQLLEWKYIYGRFFLVPQGGGFFVFPPPFVARVLFSSQNGWFFWTPLALLGFGGLLLGAWKMPRVFLPWIVVTALEVGLIGSMVTWDGADSFSSRYLASCAPLIAFGLAAILYASGRVMRITVMAAVAACCLFSILFAVQFRLDLIPRGDRLTAAECFAGKFRLREVRRQKLAVQRARDLLRQGSPDAAVATLENAEAYGEDRDVLLALSTAYQASGREADAHKAADRWSRLMQSRLW
ncbi:MAG: hypothetical protein ABSH47_17505 [Bryobacteraceae bacterium]|jgi:hypothetical protein